MRIKILYFIEKFCVSLNCNKLHVNLEKSCYMYFNNTRKIENDEKLNKFVLEISNTSLPQVEHTKFLGVIIDNKLTWQPHLTHISPTTLNVRIF